MGVIRQDLAQSDLSDATKRVSDSAQPSDSGDSSTASDDQDTGNPVADLYKRLKKRSSQKRS